MSKQTGKHVCVMCNNELESKEALQEHFRKHANKEIDLKGRQLGPSGELKEVKTRAEGYIKGTGSQINTHVVCDVCGEEFTCNTKAIQHKFKKHPHNAAKHYCPQCGMQFPLKGHRDKHLKEQHETDIVPKNPYPCYQCGAVFYNKAAHEYHHKSAHHRVVTLYKQIETPPPSKKIRYNNAGEPQSVYYCHLCGIEYIVKFNLQKHLERQHTLQERGAVPPDLYKCNTCDALFYNQKAYNNHNIYHRPDDLYVTSEEQRDVSEVVPPRNSSQSVEGESQESHQESQQPFAILLLICGAGIIVIVLISPCKLQTVTRVDQDFDIRRVQPPTEKYIPKFRRRRANNYNSKLASKKKEDEEEEMSPPPASDSEDEDHKEKRIKADDTVTST